MYGEALTTLDPDTGKRPKSRIGNASNARTLVSRLKHEDDTRMWRYAKIQGLLDGNPPWSQGTLRNLGQGHRANFNLREGEGIVESAKTPYYDLVFEVPTFVQATFDLEGVAVHLVTQWENIFSQQYYETMCGWKGFDQNVQLHQWQMVVNGVGPMFWPHGVSWKSEATKARKVLVPQETKANVDELEIVAILHSWRADELESFISGSDDLKNENFNGWNVPMCLKAIVQSANQEMRSVAGNENYDLYQRAIRTGDIFYGIHRSERIYVASVFVREFGGKVSHYIITDQALGNPEESYDSSEEEAGYLYRKKNKFNSFSEVICPFFFDTGPDGTWHAIKGLGPKIFDFCDVSNRTFCQMLDGAVIGSGVTLEAQDGASLEETQIALVGGATVVQPGYKVVQTRISESLNGAMSMRRELQNVLQSNTGSYRQRPSEENHEPTLGQAQLNFQQQALLNRGSTTRYYNSLDGYHLETVRRLLDPAQRKGIPGGEEALDFKRRCIMAGIPEDILKFKFIRKIRAVRSIGYGSPQMRDQATTQLLGLLQFMDEPGRNYALRLRVAALPGIGSAGVDSIFPAFDTKGVPNSHTALAALENNALRQPKGQAIVEPEQNHLIHFDTHMQDAMGHLKDQTAHPLEQLIHLENAGPHLQQHLENLKGDPTRKNDVRQKEKDLQSLSSQSDKLRQNLEEAIAAQPPEQNGQPDPEVLRVHGELGLKADKQRGELALKVRKQAVDEKLKDKKTAAEIRRKTLAA